MTRLYALTFETMTGGVKVYYFLFFYFVKDNLLYNKTKKRFRLGHEKRKPCSTGATNPDFPFFFSFFFDF